MVSDTQALVFVTGATGFIGGRLAEALQARGYRLRCLVRSPERAAHLTALGAELIAGDVADEAVLEQGMRGAALAYHVAGAYDLGGVDVQQMERTNVAGTRAFLRAAQTARVPRMVYVSTTAVLLPLPMDADADEEPQLRPPPFRTAYERTKAGAHEVALAAQRAGAPVVIVCPSVVYGPGDPGPVGRYLEDVLRHRIPGLSTKPSQFTYVHVADVVAGMIAAGERGRVGETYVLGGEAMTINDYTRRIAETAGTWVWPLRFPPMVARMTGTLLDMIAGVLNLRLSISRESVEMGTGMRYVHSYRKAARDLGYTPRPLSEGLPETVRDAQARLAR